MDPVLEHPLAPVVAVWLRKLKLAAQFKRKVFGKDAEVAMKFFSATKELSEHIWNDRISRGAADDEEELPAPRFRINVCKVAELVQLFGPSMYQNNPVNIVEPKTIDLPIELLMELIQTENPMLLQQAQQAAQQQGQPFNPQSLFPPDPSEPRNKLVARLLQYVLNYMQRENDKKTHSRRMIEEAIITGMGVVWTESKEVYPGGPTIIGSFQDSVKNLLFDPDCEVFEDAQWAARRCVAPRWEVSEKYGIPEKYIKKKYGTHESLDALASNAGQPGDKEARQRGESNDLIEYWEIYSKMGIGNRLSGVKELDKLDSFLDELGMHCLIVVADGIPFPLNCNPGLTRALIDDELGDEEIDTIDGLPDEGPERDPLDDEQREKMKEEMFLRFQWPIPFWMDGQWPCTALMFHEVPNCPWPMSHIKPGLGYLEFITWCMGFLANKIRTTSRTVASCMKSAGSEIKQQLFKGSDFTVIEVEASLVPDGDVSKAVHYLPMPDIKGDIWKIVQAQFDLFEKATGLTDLLYAASGGMRSAQEANIKQGAMNIRPEDMSSRVEDCLSLVSRKEAMAIRWLWEGADVEPIVGTQAASLWDRYITSDDPARVAREFSYRIEAGSTRKPNKETRVAQMNQALQQWAPLIQWSLQNINNNPDAIKILNTLLREWGEAMDMETKELLFNPPPPPPPNPIMQKVQAEIQLKQQEGQFRQQEHQQKLAFEQQKLQMQIAGQQAKTQAEVQKHQAAMQMKAAEMAQQAEHSRMQAVHDIQAQQMQIGLKAGEMQMQQQQKQQEMGLAAIQSQQQMQMDREKHAMGLRQQLHRKTDKTGDNR